jgi:hypothetical protein
MTIRLTVECLSFVCRLLFFISPSVLIYKLTKKEITFDKIPIVLIIENNLNWFHWDIYGIKIKDTFNNLNNSIFIFYFNIFIYILIFFTTTNIKNNWNSFNYNNNNCFNFIILFLLCQQIWKGYIIMVVNFIMNLSPRIKFIYFLSSNLDLWYLNNECNYMLYLCFNC